MASCLSRSDKKRVCSFTVLCILCCITLVITNTVRHVLVPKRGAMYVQYYSRNGLITVHIAHRQSVASRYIPDICPDVDTLIGIFLVN
jgi:hypothetical protein